jgi:hypothetical protein
MSNIPTTSFQCDTHHSTTDYSEHSTCPDSPYGHPRAQLSTRTLPSSSSTCWKARRWEMKAWHQVKRGHFKVSVASGFMGARDDDLDLDI